MRTPRKTRPIVFAVIGCGLYAWGRFTAHNGIERRSPWERAVSDGVQAMEAQDLATAERDFLHADDLAVEFPKLDARRGTTFQNLGWLRKQQHRYAEAEQFFRQALDILGAQREPSERQLAVVLNDLATVCAVHDPREAAGLLERAIRINRRVLGPRDHELATNYQNYAGTLLVLGRVREAAEAARRGASIDAADTGAASTTLPATLPVDP